MWRITPHSVVEVGSQMWISVHCNVQRIASMTDILTIMKNQSRKDRKLSLRMETVRELDKLELAEVAGGQVTTTVLQTHLCPTARICLTTPVP